MYTQANDKGREAVDEYFAALDHRLKELAAELRGIILAASNGITEHIKWNAPSFCYGGDDRITFNMRSANEVRVIFHRGAKKNMNGSRPGFEDHSGLLTWLGEDRGMVTFTGSDQLSAVSTEFSELVRRWVEQG